MKGNQAMESLGIDVVLHDPQSVQGAFADTFKMARSSAASTTRVTSCRG